jgi:hypothetical protein
MIIFDQPGLAGQRVGHFVEVVPAPVKISKTEYTRLRKGILVRVGDDQLAAAPVLIFLAYLLNRTASPFSNFPPYNGANTSVKGRPWLGPDEQIGQEMFVRAVLPPGDA